MFGLNFENLVPEHYFLLVCGYAYVTVRCDGFLYERQALAFASLINSDTWLYTSIVVITRR